MHPPLPPLPLDPFFPTWVWGLISSASSAVVMLIPLYCCLLEAENHPVDDSEIPNNHLGCVQNPVNNGMNYQPQVVSQISEPSTALHFGFFWCSKNITGDGTKDFFSETSLISATSKWLFANELQVTSGDCQIPDASTVHLLVWIPVLWRKWWPSRMFAWYDVSWQGRLVHNCSEMQIEIIAGSHQASRLLSAFVILDAVDISSGEPHVVKRDAPNITDRGLQDVFCRDSPNVSEISSFLYLQLGLLGNLKNGWHGHGVLVDSPCWEVKKSKVPDIRKRWDFFDDLSSKLQKKDTQQFGTDERWAIFFSSSVLKDGLRFSCDISDWFQKIGRRQHSGVSKCFKSPLLMQRSARQFTEEHGFIVARIESLQQCWRGGFRRERRWTTINLYIKHIK